MLVISAVGTFAPAFAEARSAASPVVLGTGFVVALILSALGLVAVAVWTRRTFRRRLRGRRTRAIPERHKRAKVRSGVIRMMLALIGLGWVLTGCARDVVMLNPRTGETTTCRASSLNPWSQQEGCVGDHIAQGWKRLESRER